MAGRRRTVIGLVAVTGLTLAGTTAAQAVIGSDEGANDAYRFAAHVRVGELPGRGCTGALIAPQWVITAKACFGIDVPIGAPAERTTVTVGRTDLAGTGGRVLAVNRVVPHPDRDVVLARLAARVTDVPPVPVATTPAGVGDELRLLGFGRTATAWVTDRLHGATATVDAAGTTTIGVTGADPDRAAVCKGDAGGPAVRATAGGVELVGLHHSSGQAGCLDADGGETGVTETRVDDLAAWISGTAISTCNTAGGVVDQAGLGVALVDFTGDCAADIVHQNTAGQLHGWPGRADLSADGRLFPGTAKRVGTGWTQTAIERILLGDFNGDGRSDIIGQRAGGELSAWASSGDMTADDRLFSGSGASVGRGWSPANVVRILTGDFTGEGRTDIAAVYADGKLRAWPSTGTFADSALFVGQGSLHSNLGLTTAAYPRLFTMDADGDGRADLVGQAADGALRMWRATGDLSGPDTAFTGPGARVGTGWTTRNIPRILTGDFTGDGRDDIAAVAADGKVRAWSSSGVIADSALFPGGGSVHDTTFTTATHPRLLVGDADRDGKVEVIAHNADGRLLAYRSTGNASGANTLFPPPARLVGSGWLPQTYPRVF